MILKNLSKNMDKLKMWYLSKLPKELKKKKQVAFTHMGAVTLVIMVLATLTVGDLYQEQKYDVSAQEYQLVVNDYLIESIGFSEVLNASFKDLCTPVYIKAIKAEGEKLIELSKEFKLYKVKNQEENQIVRYLEYQIVFDKYEQIGKQLLKLSENLNQNNYPKAKLNLRNIKQLIEQIPDFE